MIKEAYKKENTEEKIRTEEMNKEMKYEKNGERDSKFFKRWKRRKPDLRSIDETAAKDNEELKSTDTSHSISKGKIIDFGGSSSLAIEPANKLEPQDKKHKRKTTLNDANNVVFKSTKNTESSVKYLEKKKTALRIRSVVATKDANEQDSSSNKPKEEKMALTGCNEVVDGNDDELKRNKMKGMIFMCNSETRKDCFRYKVFGLPTRKKESVLKVSSGMKLFLFDYESKLMYGIYKAAGSGDFNIEPRAFKSAFPAQVRFTIIDKCMPVPEEKFSRVIKDNYYTQNKFNLELTSEQVKNLCKLFKVSSKGPKSEQLGRSLRSEDHQSGERKRTTWHPSRTETRPYHRREETHRFPNRGRVRWHSQEQERKHAFNRDHPYGERPNACEREAFASPSIIMPFASPSQDPTFFLESSPPHTFPPYDYEGALEFDNYRRDQEDEYYDPHPSDLELRHHFRIDHRDSFPPYEERPFYREPFCSAGSPMPHHFGRRPPPEYRPLRGPVT